ncbi:FtsX-like permease family protein [Anaerovorax odorimutans]|uniref:FtsX-like permease family protein n=1 Tax=Anaerovorax odorimutans TaxID=109327 RepID=A0ABT1RTL8_9FIRM|nr:FtsX-like permease family protein [Anaerovorax odorimutans]MCQ4638201.1 FtsX-like permease family protein [Anaerovorax odorimutans]
MTLNNLFSKLRKRNKGNYRQFIFCITFAVILIASFSEVIFSPLIQSVLPVGGDSKKQVYMIFAMAVVGCLLFSIYAAGLFLRYKSRETGVFLALGAKKGKLSRALLTEITLLTGICTLAGLAAGTVLALLIGQGFKALAVSPVENDSMMSLAGIGTGLLFGCIVLICLMVMSVRFMKRSNLMDIINEQRRSEPIKKMVTARYAVIGSILVVLGILGGLLIPSILARVFEKNLGAMPNLFYVLALIGLYMLLVYSIAVHKKGRNPQKYYKNMISYGMMKFQGASVVRNMLVITLLIIASLFACFYGPTNYINGKVDNESNPVDFALTYPENADEVKRADIEELAEQHNVDIRDYREGQFIRLLASGVERENYDSKGNLIEIYKKQLCYQEFISQKEYNRITGQKERVERGSYKLIKKPETEENLWYRFDDLDHVKNTATGQSLDLKYGGTVSYQALVQNDGFVVNGRCVLNDADFSTMKKGLSRDQKIKQILFNAGNAEKSYDFAKGLYREYCLRASEEMKVVSAYDDFQKKEALAQGKEYGYDIQVELLPDHSEVDLGWKYTPNFKILNQKNAFFSFILYYMLFIYVAVICLAAVGIISYTRSINTGLSGKQVFDDLRKLGANNRYIRRLIVSQLKKIFVLPTSLGAALMLGYYILLLWQNDGRLLYNEYLTLGVDLILCAIIALYQYLMYRLSLKRVMSLVIPK